MTQPAKRGRNISGDFYSNFKRKARYRNIEWDLTLNDLDLIMEKQNFKCPYTGRSISADGYKKYSASLDRIDSSKGYTVDNVQFVWTPLNNLKGSLTEEAFLGMVEQIYRHKIAYQDIEPEMEVGE